MNFTSEIFENVFEYAEHQERGTHILGYEIDKKRITDHKGLGHTNEPDLAYGAIAPLIAADNQALRKTLKDQFF